VRVLSAAHRLLGAAFAVLGVLYVTRGALTLFHLHAVVERWTRFSGDPDFRYDIAPFMAYVGAGAVLVLALGALTAWNGVAAARGHRSHWLALALAAMPIHWCWLLYRIVGSGALGRAAHDGVRHDLGIQFAVVCAAYWIMCVLTAFAGYTGEPMIRRALVAALLAGAPVLAHAQSSSAPLVVSATVVSTCSVDVASSAPASAFATMPVGVTCARGAIAARVQRPFAARSDARDALLVIDF
jgi:hypothetical protein